MRLWMAALAAAAGLVGFFAWANRQTAKAHARFTVKDVEAALAELLDPQARTHDNWDLFLAWPIDDAYLESIRRECLQVWQECSHVPGRDISEEGANRVAAVLAELRRRTNRGTGPADNLSGPH